MNWSLRANWIAPIGIRRLLFLESHPSVPSSPPDISLPSPSPPLRCPPLFTSTVAVSWNSLDLRGRLASSTSQSEYVNSTVRPSNTTPCHVLKRRLQHIYRFVAHCFLCLNRVQYDAGPRSAALCNHSQCSWLFVLYIQSLCVRYCEYSYEYYAVCSASTIRVQVVER